MGVFCFEERFDYVWDKEGVLFTGFKEVRVTFLTGGFFYSQVVWQGGSEWNSPLRGEIIRVGDVNGDGYTDLIVHDTGAALCWS